MSLTVTAPDIESMPVLDRLNLIERLWDSIPDSGMTIPQWHKDELDRRLADADANPEAGIPWEQVLAELRSRS